MPSPQEVFLLFFHGLLYNCVTQLFHLNGLTNDFRGASAKFSGVLRVELQLLFLCTQVFRSVLLVCTEIEILAGKKNLHKVELLF